MPIQSFINTNLFRAYAAGVFSDEDLAMIETLNRLVWDGLLEDPKHPELESRSSAVLRRLVLAADELRSLGDWLASYAFPLTELLDGETEDDRLAAYRAEAGRRFGQHLLALTARFQEACHPTPEEVRRWRESLPDHVPYWSLGEPLSYPPPVTPPARDAEGLVLSSVSEDLRHLRELLEQAARHYSWMIRDLPTRETDAEEPIPHLVRELGDLRDRLAELAREVKRLIDDRVGRNDDAGKAPTPQRHAGD